MSDILTFGLLELLLYFYIWLKRTAKNQSKHVKLLLFCSKRSILRKQTYQKMKICLCILSVSPQICFLLLWEWQLLFLSTLARPWSPLDCGQQIFLAKLITSYSDINLIKLFSSTWHRIIYIIEHSLLKHLKYFSSFVKQSWMWRIVESIMERNGFQEMWFLGSGILIYKRKEGMKMRMRCLVKVVLLEASHRVQGFDCDRFPHILGLSFQFDHWILIDWHINDFLCIINFLATNNRNSILE